MSYPARDPQLHRGIDGKANAPCCRQNTTFDCTSVMEATA